MSATEIGGGESQMQKVIGVKFRIGSKIYYFNPLEEEFNVDDYVIVETAKGLEYAKIAMANVEKEDSEIKRELKPIVRKANEKDLKQISKLEGKRENVLKVTTEKAESRNLKMKIVDCEYSFDEKKVTIYFTAEGRVDFRELVKDLASALHTRIELRQIYERDDIRMRGALAPCGRPCCCSYFLGDYEKVSIKMAKVQGLSLSPTKISGMCGKLMCCLKYENEYYMETAKQMPKMRSKVTTPEGEGVVEQLDILKKEILVRIKKGEDDVFRKFSIDQINAKEKINTDELDGDDTIPEEDQDA